MIEFINSNLASVVIVIALVIVLIVLYKLGNKSIVKKIILALVVKAEKTLGSGTNELKYAMVIDSLYIRLPLILKIVFTKKEIDEFIEEAVIKLKKILSSGVTLTGYDDEKYINALKDNEYDVK